MKKIITIIISFIASLQLSTLALAQNVNMVQEDIIRVAGVNHDTMIYALSAFQRSTTCVYTDGFGRSIQKIMVGGTPNQADLVQPITYDAQGRQIISYQPYADNNGIGTYRSDAFTRQAAFYSNGTADKVADDSMPFSKQLIENSPLGRLLKAGSVGNGFQTDQHYTAMNYRANTTAADGAITLWLPDGTRSGAYADNKLSVVEATGPDGNKALSFTDDLGRLVMKRVVLDASRNLDTYYIYNEARTISYLVPPKAVRLLSDNSSYTLLTGAVSPLLYRYQYDTKGRLSVKTIPGAGDLYVIYDPLDRPVLFQDANLRVGNRWNFVKYNMQGRAVVQGIYVDATRTTAAAMQTYVDGMAAAYNNQWYEKRSSAVTTAYYTNTIFPSTGTTLLSAVYFDDYDLDQNGTADFSYSNQGMSGESSATLTTRGLVTITRILTVGSGISSPIWLTKVTFYDKNYRPIRVKSNNHLVTVMNDVATVVSDFSGVTQQVKVIKYHTASVATTVLSSYNYDHATRVRSITQRYNNGAENTVASYDYNELGQLVDKQLGLITTSAIPPTLTLNTTYSGTNNFQATQSIAMVPGFEVSSGSNFSAGIFNNYLQSVDYRYNIRGQLTSINNSKLAADNAGTNALNTNDDLNDVFGEEIIYDQVNTALGNTGLFSGNISGVKWMSIDGSNTKSNERSYRYSYDAAGRFTQAIYAERLSSASSSAAFSLNVNGFTEKVTGYDENGNIQGLIRYSATVGGSGGTKIDGLKYGYDPNNLNKLLSVTDSTGNNNGYRNYTGAAANYGYDNAGNLSSDPYKGLTIAAYNVLNRADKLTMSFPATATGRYIDYTYDATGKLLRKRAFDNNTLQTTTDYIDGFQYVTAGAGTANLDFFVMPEGRVRNVATSGVTLKQEFVITDHQGNARISFEDNGSGQALVKQENSYYAFGMSMTSAMGLPTNPNKNLYNGGSEWQNDFANQPDWQQTFYRNYDQVLGRFMAADPMAEANTGVTVYQYAANNPVMMNDPLGNLQEYNAWRGGRVPIQDYSNGLYGFDQPSGIFSDFWENFMSSFGGGGNSQSLSFKNGTFGDLYNSWKSGSESFNNGTTYYFKNDGTFDGTMPSGSGATKIAVQGSNERWYFSNIPANQGGRVSITSSVWEINRIAASFGVSGYNASGLQIIQVYQGAGGSTGRLAFVDGGINSPFAKQNGGPAQPGKPYYLTPSEVASDVTWNGTNGSVLFSDHQTGGYYNETSRFYTILVATNYNGSGVDKLLGGFTWGYNNTFTPINNGAITYNPSVSPIAIKILQQDYPGYQFK